jgi:hypothetical protein
MAEVVQAIRQGLTLGEISQALEGVWGRIS